MCVSKLEPYVLLGLDWVEPWCNFLCISHVHALFMHTYLFMPLSPIPSLLISPSWVPSVRCLFDRVRPSFDRSSHKPRRQLLQPIPLLPLLQVVVWLLRRLWCNFSALLLALTFSLMRWVRWPPMWVVLHDVRLALVASLLLPILLPRLLRMRMRMLALPVMRRWPLLSDLIFVIRDKKRK